MLEFVVFVATVIVSALLAALLVMSAAMKLRHQESFVAGYIRLGVPEDKLNYLALVLIAGAAGLLLGLTVAPIGVAAAVGVILYFVAAIGFHIRANDTKNVPMPAVFLVLGIIALVLRLATL
jgi:hypothetical protein